MDSQARNARTRLGKRALDLSLVLLAAPFWVPVLGVVALLVRAMLGSPVFFRQPRPGQHGRIFEVIKFGTMTDAKNAGGALLPDEDRLVPFGKWLRSTSLDELPELLNVLRGDMSLVGPRPLFVEYLDRYNSEQARRHEVLPGITGWAQVNGRNAISWERKFELDVWYVDHCSLWLDLRILALTFLKVFQREGISADGHATMPDFGGSLRNDQTRGSKTSDHSSTGPRCGS
jgi:lipopolysaccharide/colanic/teichoic acid biosynthesis glycosyltransferase